MFNSIAACKHASWEKFAAASVNIPKLIQSSLSSSMYDRGRHEIFFSFK